MSAWLDPRIETVARAFGLPTRRSGIEFLGTLTIRWPNVEQAAAYALPYADSATSVFGVAGAESRSIAATPRPSTGVFRAFLRMHRPLTSTFGRRLLCLWGLFMGTYSAFAYAAYARWRGRERPVRCGFAAKARVGRSVA